MSSVHHPVHIVNKEGGRSPSAFIPFCEFGSNMSSMGVRIEEFDVPVCNSIKAKVLNDQLCYEVDLNRFSNKDNIENELKSGFVFIMDYNEDRQINTIQGNKANTTRDESLTHKIVKSNDNQHAFIYLNTVGL